MLASGTIIANSKLEALSEDSETNGVITVERSHFYVVNDNSFGKMDVFSSIAKEIINEESEAYVKEFQVGVTLMYILGNAIFMVIGWNNIYMAWRASKINTHKECIFMAFSQDETTSLIKNAKFFLESILLPINYIQEYQ